MTPAPFFPGFDPRWRDVPDYVLGITREIWEERRIDALKYYYAEDLVVRTPAAVMRGNQPATAATLASLSEFPDRALLGEDVIWTETPPRDADKRPGFLASHRMTSLATHRGAGLFGPPTGRRVRYRILSDCWCSENQVRDAWQVQDMAAILPVFGETAESWARRQIEAEGGPEHCLRPLSPDTDVDGPYGGTGPRSSLADGAVDALTRMMAGELSTVATFYDRACQLSYAGGIEEIGHEQAERFWLGLRSAFPSASFRVEHRIGRDDPQHPPRVALRWSLYGKHDGWGHFGAPTGAYVFVMGITHLEYGPRGLRRDCTLYDAVAIWKQILLAQG